MKKILLLASMCFAGDVFAETAFRGLLTIDRFPDDRCTVTEFSTFKVENWVSAANPEQLQATLAALERQFEEGAKSSGYDAVLGFTTNFLGGAGGVVQSTPTNQQHNVVISGVINLRGVGVKLKCKK